MNDQLNYYRNLEQATTYRNSLTDDEKAIFDAGIAYSVLERRIKDKAEVEQIFRQCTRRPEPRFGRAA